MLTINQIITQVKDLATAHHQIREVGVGTIAELQAKEREYPLLWISHESGSLDGAYKINNIRLTVFDRVLMGQEGQDDSFHEQDVLSDTETILLDFLNYFHQQHLQRYARLQNAPLEHFTERTNDRTAGWSTVLELRQFYDWNKCSIPETGATIDPTVDGLTLYDFSDQSVLDRLTDQQELDLIAELCGDPDPVQIQVNGVDTETAESGTTYDQAIHDSAGDNVGTAANPSVVGDATVENSDASYSGTVKAEGNLVLPNITFTDSDGSASNVPSVQDITATPCSTIKSVALSISDTSPDFGDVITLTATPSNITPTKYFFFAWQESTDTFHFLQESASNTYVWTTDVIGDWSIHVIADDGTDYVAACEAITIAEVFDADAIAYLTAAGIPNDSTVYFSGTPQEITGSEYWDHVSDFFIALKNASIYTKAYWMRLGIGGTANIHKYNLVDPQDTDAAYRATFNGGWTHSKEGYVSNGVNAYSDTHFAPNGILSANSSAYACYLRTQTPSGQTNWAYGSSDVNLKKCSGYLPRSASSRTYPLTGNAFNFFGGIAVADTDGMHVISRTNSTESNLYIGGVLENTLTTAFTGHSTNNEYSGAFNNNGTIQYGISNTFGFEGRFDGLDATEAADLSSAVTTLMTNLGLNV